MKKDLHLPQVIAHRGAPRLAPENTLSALRAAKQQGASWVEFDVMLSADHVPLVFHDDTLERTTNGTGKLCEKTYAEIAVLDAGSWFSAEFSQEKVPSLSEFLLCAQALNLQLNIELKTESPTEILQLLKQHWKSSTPPLISSFSHTALNTLKKHSDHYPLGLNLEAWTTADLTLAKKLDCYSIHLDHTIINATIAALIKKNGFRLLAYTVNDAQHANELFAMGVDAVFSDIPNLLSKEPN